MKQKVIVSARHITLPKTPQLVKKPWRFRKRVGGISVLIFPLFRSPRIHRPY